MIGGKLRIFLNMKSNCVHPYKIFLLQFYYSLLLPIYFSLLPYQLFFPVTHSFICLCIDIVIQICITLSFVYLFCTPSCNVFSYRHLPFLIGRLFFRALTHLFRFVTKKKGQRFHSMFPQLGPQRRSPSRASHHISEKWGGKPQRQCSACFPLHNGALVSGQRFLSPVRHCPGR